MNKSRVYKWIIALLVVLNLSTIGTILVNRYHNEQQSESIVTDSTIRVNGRYFRKEIGFDNKQMQHFRKANRTFQPRARQLLFQIDSLKQESFDELNELKPDTLHLNLLAAQIGEKHGQLKKATHSFYLAVKQACTPEQALRLREIFSPLFKDATPCTDQKNQHINNKKTFKIKEL